MTKLPLPTDPYQLVGIYQAALVAVAQGSREASATTAARSILAKFKPHPHQVERWLVLGLAREIAASTEPDEDENQGA
jgi:hypothetical protein